MPSDSPPPLEIGKNSTDSSTTSASRVEDAIEANASVNRLAKMAAVESLDRNLVREDSEAKRWGRQLENVDGPCGDGDGPQKEDDPMRIMAAGDVTVYQRDPPSEPLATPALVPPPLPTARKPAGTLAKLAIGGALLASGAGAGLAVPWLLGAFNRPEPPPASAGYEYLGRMFDPGQNE